MVATDVFVVCCCWIHCCCWMHCCCVAHTGTKGLQCPGIRVGWVVASKQNITTLANFSSFGMGGVSHPSQLYAVALLEPSRGTPYSLPFFLVVVLPVLVHRWWSCCCSNRMLVFFFFSFSVLVLWTMSWQTWGKEG